MRVPRIVLVEDEALLIAHLRSSLTRWGYDVVGCASSRDEALRVVRETGPDLVLMDIVLKGDADGIETARDVRRIAEVPIVYLTAVADAETVNRAKDTYAYGYVVKPFSDTELRITIEVALQRHRTFVALRRRTEWLDATLASLGEAVLTTDMEGRITFMNARAERLTGWRLAEASLVRVADVLRVAESGRVLPSGTEHFVDQVLRSEAVVLLGPATRLIGRNGEETHVECCAAPIRDRNDEVGGAVVVFRDATSRAEDNERLVRLALHDPLTGLANRSLFQESLRQAIARARRSGTTAAVLLVDLDYFKSVNDTLGHIAGDAVLVEMSSRISACVRESDTVARLGGDEIAVIQSDIDDRHGATALAEKLVTACGQPIVVDGTPITVTASVGVALFPRVADDPERILRSADGALYRAKTQGRNRVVVASDSPAEAHGVWPLPRHEIRHALERSELEVFLQPVFRLTEGSISAAEALVRWNHPVQGLIPASRFIQAAEQTGVIGSIVRLSLLRACEAAAAWLDRIPELCVSINLSDSVLHSHDLVEMISSVLSETKLAPDHLVLEVGDRPLHHTADDQVRTRLGQLRDLGAHIGIDRFGRDRESFLGLGMFPVSTVKIDRSLLRGVPEDPRAVGMLTATLEILDRLGVEAVAVGVETEAQLEWLNGSGCQLAQGNQLGLPVEIDTFYRVHVDAAG